MKRETKQASKQVTAVFNALRRLGAASGERIAKSTRLPVATVGSVLADLSAAGIASYGRSGLWILECAWFDGVDGKCASSAVEVVTVLNTMRALAMATIEQLVKASGLGSVHAAGWSCEQLRKAGRLEYTSTFEGWKLAA
jgi:hypothetical protein